MGSVNVGPELGISSAVGKKKIHGRLCQRNGVLSP